MTGSIILSEAHRVSGFDLSVSTLLLPGIPLAFEDPDAAAYFLSLGIGEASETAAVHTFGRDEVDIDPRTMFGGREDPRMGEPVLKSPAKDVAAYAAAAAARGEATMEVR